MPSNESSRARKAERRPDALADAFEALAAEEAPAFEPWRRRVEARLAEDPAGPLPKGESVMPNWTTWRSLRAAAAAALLLIVVACTVPLDYDRSAGTDVELLVSGDPGPVLAELRGGPWVLENLNVSEADGGTRIVARLVDADPAEVERRLAGAGVLDLNAAEALEEARGTLFDMVMDNVFHVHLDISGMSDEEINAQLAAQLADIGWTGQVQVSRQDGFPQVTVEVERPEGAPDGELRIELTDQQSNIVEEGVWVQDGPGLNLDLGDLEGLSEDQIRARVEERLRAQGIDPDSVQVFVQHEESGEGDGREVREEMWITVDDDGELHEGQPEGVRVIELKTGEDGAR